MWPPGVFVPSIPTLRLFYNTRAKAREKKLDKLQETWVSHKTSIAIRRNLWFWKII
jgi:hypothetical protein